MRNFLTVKSSDQLQAFYTNQFLLGKFFSYFLQLALQNKWLNCPRSPKIVGWHVFIFPSVKSVKILKWPVLLEITAPSPIWDRITPTAPAENEVTKNIAKYLSLPVYTSLCTLYIVQCILTIRSSTSVTAVTEDHLYSIYETQDHVICIILSMTLYHAITIQYRAIWKFCQVQSCHFYT